MKKNDPIKRRDFIKTVSITGASIALSSPAVARTYHFRQQTPEITNKYFTVGFDPHSGMFHVQRSNGDIFIANGTSAVNSNIGKLLVAAENYTHSVESIGFKDQLGSGQKLKVISIDSESNLDVEIHLSLYESHHCFTVEAICKNVSSNDLAVHSIEPFRAIGKEGGALHIEGVSKCITNGALYYDAGMIHTFGKTYVKPEPYGETKGGRLANNALSSISETVNSWWNVGFFSGYDKEGIVAGYIDNNVGLGQILLSRNDTNQISILAESVYSPGLVLQPGKSLSSNRFMVSIASDPYSALEMYAGIVGFMNQARISSIINGWCSWFYTYEHITEDEVICNAEFAAHHLKPYGFEYIQIDEGFQRCHGDWEGNERFPHGMKWLAEKIKSLHLKPGLWIAPFVVSEKAGIFQNHPDWFLKNPDNSLKRVGPWPDEDTAWAKNENPKRYGLDITHPGAAEWLYNLMDTVANKWGYEMIKIDFVAWSILSANQFYDQSVTPGQAYRRGLEIIRNAVGEKCHILDCGPGQVSVGLIDSMRIELDQNYGYSKDAWKQYFLHSSSSAPAVAKRYYFHKKTWINDADHICISLLSIIRAQAAATIIALSGGNTISGDRLSELDGSKLDIIKKVIPSFGETARPVGLFDTDLQTVFALKIKKQFAEWTVIGFFNPDLKETVVRNYPLERFWLEPDRTYLAYDFWKEEFFGELSKEINVTVPAGAVTLLTVHEKLGTPQFISTSRHVLQGAVELENVHWDPGTKILTGVSNGPLNTSHNVYIFLPDSQLWDQNGRLPYKDFKSYSIRMVDEKILRIHVDFDMSEKVEWEFNPFGDFI
ncbi:MAG: glycoside hydrolase family 36 protein [Bacteroidota bacterium]